MISEEQPFTPLDIAFARFLGERTPFDYAQKNAFENLVMSVSREQRLGHSCVRIDDESKALMLASGLAILHSPAETKEYGIALPLVVEHDRLYLHRYWFYENRLAMQVKTIAQFDSPLGHQGIDDLEALIHKYFGSYADAIDWQREAAKMAVNNSFTIITGGPGTGKTTTVVKILALMQELTDQPLVVALAAPTGKAAMRLQESIGFNKAALPCSEAIKNHIPDTVTTLHRLLGAKPPSPYFRHDATKPLVYDLVIVDEASMVGLALMSKLLDALKPGARLILLGDKDQLASVETGAVLEDLTMALPDHTVALKQSHRFDQAIKKLAMSVNLQKEDLAWQILREGNGNVSVLEQDVVEYVAQQQADYLSLIKHGVELAEIYQAFSRFQVLCSNRGGQKGVNDINYRVEQRLFEQKLIDQTGTWYSGRPVIVTQNNSVLHLYNGDIGLCLPDKANGGKLMVFFLRADGSVKKYLPGRMPQCDTVFAMTIHKSQGSEFDEVLIVLPDTLSPILSKELLYTAITRARRVVKVVADEAVFTGAIRQKVERVTGLVDKFRPEV
jgi:exodeoxyribonuclease V alpha subunit